MESTLIFLIFCAISISASPIQDSSIDGYSLDVSDPLTNDSIVKMASHRYAGIIARVFQTNTTSFDKSMVSTLTNSVANRLRVEGYMAPTMLANLNGPDQFDKVYDGLRANNLVNLNAIWIQVNDTKLFSKYTADNVWFIDSIVQRGLQHNFNIGIFTNAKMWKKITGNYLGLPATVRLWYWANNGEGVYREGAPNFNDFVAFGSWTSPDMKQFAVKELVDGAIVNRNVFVVRKS